MHKVTQREKIETGLEYRCSGSRVPHSETLPCTQGELWGAEEGDGPGKWRLPGYWLVSVGDGT